LDLVLKSDTVGTLQAVLASLDKIHIAGVAVHVIGQGVGPVTKSDLMMAVTGSRLVVGFCVDVAARLEAAAKEQSVEVRLYEVIYDLVRDVERIAKGVIPSDPEERVTGQAQVIALFKSSRKGIILGCQVSGGKLARGKRFRVITAMGPVYQGTVESLHVEEHAVKEAGPGQQVGLKIHDFKDAKIGDLVECYEPARADATKIWRPKGGVHWVRASEPA
jgi:translation initiation factor IF-2